MKIGSITILSLGLLAGCAQYHRSDDKAIPYHISLPWGCANTVALSLEPGAAVSNSVLCFFTLAHASYTTVEKYLDPIKDIIHTGGARVCVPRTSRRSSLPECGTALLA
jgi:hypothetical protein